MFIVKLPVRNYKAGVSKKVARCELHGRSFATVGYNWEKTVSVSEKCPVSGSTRWVFLIKWPESRSTR